MTGAWAHGLSSVSYGRRGVVAGRCESTQQGPAEGQSVGWLRASERRGGCEPVCGAQGSSTHTVLGRLHNCKPARCRGEGPTLLHGRVAAHTSEKCLHGTYFVATFGDSCMPPCTLWPKQFTSRGTQNTVTLSQCPQSLFLFGLLAQVQGAESCHFIYLFIF